MNFNKENVKPMFINYGKKRWVNQLPSMANNAILSKRRKVPISGSHQTTNCSTTSKFITPLNNPSSKLSSGLHTSSNSRTASTRRSDESRIILTLTEGRGQATGVVGIAYINVNKPTLVLSQISDCQSYNKTLIVINAICPKEIIIPLTFTENVSKNRLLTILESHFTSIKITCVPRNSFNSTLGMQYINHLSSAEYNSVTLILKHKYYALAATSAMLKYIEESFNVIYTSHSIKVEYKVPEDTALIDIDTADRLELVSCVNGDGDLSLLSILDHCCTNIGKRLLRSTVLQPPYSQEIVEARLDCVQEILENPDLQRKLQVILKKFSDIDYFLMFGLIMPHTENDISEKQLNYALRLKSIMGLIEPLNLELAVTKHPVLRAIYQNLSREEYKDISTKIGTILHDEAHPAKGHAGDVQRCFAIKVGINGLLDVARKTYTEIIDDMRKYVDDLSMKYDLPLRMNFNNKRSFHILLLRTRGMRNVTTPDLPAEFIQVEKNSNSYSMTTQSMVEFSGRVKRVSEEINSISNVLIYNLLLELKPHVSCLYQLCDDIALLDVLLSLSQVSAMINFVRPQFSQFMEIEGSRHPLFEYNSLTEFVPNPVFATDHFNFHIITGPNMSGKSIYIRQIVLIQIMAQIGCYVPAQSATLRLADRIFARIGFNDNFESNASSFILEMKEVQNIFNLLTDNSLIIIDELCRSTCYDEGTSIAAAICEKFIKCRAFTFLATHFLYLTTFKELYHNVSNWQLEVKENDIGNNARLEFTYHLIPGVTSIQNYSLKLAKVCAISNFIIERAEEILHGFLPLSKTLKFTQDTEDENFIQYQQTATLKLLEMKDRLTVEVQSTKVSSNRQRTGQGCEKVSSANKNVPSVQHADNTEEHCTDSSSDLALCNPEFNRETQHTNTQTFSSPRLASGYTNRDNNSPISTYNYTNDKSRLFLNGAEKYVEAVYSISDCSEEIDKTSQYCNMNEVPQVQQAMINDGDRESRSSNSNGSCDRTQGDSPIEVRSDPTDCLVSSDRLNDKFTFSNQFIITNSNRFNKSSVTNTAVKTDRRVKQPTNNADGKSASADSISIKNEKDQTVDTSQSRKNKDNTLGLTITTPGSKCQGTENKGILKYNFENYRTNDLISDKDSFSHSTSKKSSAQAEKYSQNCIDSVKESRKNNADIGNHNSCEVSKQTSDFSLYEYKFSLPLANKGATSTPLIKSNKLPSKQVTFKDAYISATNLTKLSNYKEKSESQLRKMRQTWNCMQNNLMPDEVNEIAVDISKLSLNNSFDGDVIKKENHKHSAEVYKERVDAKTTAEGCNNEPNESKDSSISSAKKFINKIFFNESSRHMEENSVLFDCNSTVNSDDNDKRTLDKSYKKTNVLTKKRSSILNKISNPEEAHNNNKEIPPEKDQHTTDVSKCDVKSQLTNLQMKQNKPSDQERTSDNKSTKQTSIMFDIPKIDLTFLKDTSHFKDSDKSVKITKCEPKKLKLDLSFLRDSSEDSKWIKIKSNAGASVRPYDSPVEETSNNPVRIADVLFKPHDNNIDVNQLKSLSANIKSSSELIEFNDVSFNRCDTKINYLSQLKSQSGVKYNRITPQPSTSTNLFQSEPSTYLKITETICLVSNETTGKTPLIKETKLQMSQSIVSKINSEKKQNDTLSENTCENLVHPKLNNPNENYNRYTKWSSSASRQQKTEINLQKRSEVDYFIMNLKKRSISHDTRDEPAKKLKKRSNQYKTSNFMFTKK